MGFVTGSNNLPGTIAVDAQTFMIIKVWTLRIKEFIVK